MAGKSTNKHKGKNAAAKAQAKSEDAAAPPSSREAPAVAAAPVVDAEQPESNPSSDETKDVVVAEQQPQAATEKNGGGDEQRLFPMKVKGPSGEQIDLQVSPADSVMDLRQFLLDAPESCFYTCYDLFLHNRDGTKSQLAEYLEIGEVADITGGGCWLEMVNAVYDDRSVRSHVRRTRDLISTSNVYFSLSTALAMEFEKKHNPSGDKGGKSADSKEAVSETTELEAPSFMNDTSKLLKDLVTDPAVPDIKCVQSISFSSFNPVPGYRKLVGDLVYLDINVLEGKHYCVTASTLGFFVNSSKGHQLNPAPLKSGLESTTLVGLLHQLSPAFSTGFAEVLKRKAAGHPFENVPVLLPPNNWLGPFPPPAHKRDVARAEDAMMSPYGTEVLGLQRDWNEELQSCRDFPRESPQDRIMRDRALYKVNCDFVDAAIKGAKAVIGRCIPPINPTDPERFHMYVHNNIFFSFAVDGDFMLMQQSREAAESESKPAESETKNTTPKVEDQTPPSEESDAPNGKAEPESNEIVVAASAPLEAKDDPNAADGEQATYSSANNDLKGTKAYNNADVSGLYTLAMAIVDYRGHRVVAQSIIPGILQGDKTESLLYGSLDNGKKISWNEKFHAKVLEAGKVLHIKEHEVLDGSGQKVKLCAPVECKGIVGSDNRYYILDLMRTFPRDVSYTGAGSRLCVLRPELVAAFCQAESIEILEKQKADGEADGEAKELPPILLNPNVFTDFTVAGDPEEKASDEAYVRKAGDFLVKTVIPKFIQDLSSVEVSPMSGQSLTEALHAHGINVRYLGKIAELTKHLPHIYDLCVIEMVVRSAKHVFKGVLRDTLDQDVAGAISHFMNCLFGGDVAPVPVYEDSSPVKSPAKKKKKDKPSSPEPEPAKEKQPLYTCITPELVWIDVKENVKFKYQYDLPDDARARVRKISSVRNLCLKVGLTLAAGSYNFDSKTPFQQADILDLQAVVKHASPVCADAQELMESGKLRLAQGKVQEAYELFSEAFFILQQVCGPMHREVANCCRYLAMVLYQAGDMGGAIMQQHKELIINERCLGQDHPDTAHSYGNMALFYHGLNQTDLALKHMGRTLLLLNASCGSDHPDVAATFINIAVMYQELGNMHVALRYLQKALTTNERLLGSEHIQTAVCYHALAIAFNCMGAFKLSIQHEKSTHAILSKQLGEEDPRTRESANWIRTFQLRENQQRGAMLAQRENMKRSDLVQVLQTAGGRTGNSHGLTKAAAALLGAELQMPRTSRGLDERAARAAAEVRKKAAAKGLNVRSNDVINARTNEVPFSEYINMLNNLPATASNGSSSKEKNGNGGATSSAGVEGQPPPSENSTPIGLGDSLGSLEVPKKKKKSRVAAPSPK